MIQWWIIKCFFLFILIKYSSVNCTHNECNYIVKKSDNSSDTCVANQCYQFIDLVSIMVEPKTCKTSVLFLSFSSYKNFILFRDQLQWKLGDLFSSRLINEYRQFILFIDQLDYNDRPFDHNELIHLGINIDLYILYIRNIRNKNYLYGSIHYDPNHPQWNIIKIKFRCLKLSAFDRYPCSSEIISPPLFAPQRPPSILESTTNITDQPNHFLSFSSMEESVTKSNEEKKTSVHLILIIIIPLLIVLITILCFILVYIYITGKFCFNRDTMTTPQSPSRTNTSNQPISIERISSSSVSLSDNAVIPENRLNINHVQNPTLYDDYHHRTKIHSTKNFDNNYEKVTLDNISVIGQQYFVPISSSIHF